MVTRIRRINQQNLLPGDVLLSCGKNKLSQWIRRIAGGDYSHAGLWDGAYVIDAKEEGVKRDTLAFVLNKQAYVDAYRWQPIPPNGHYLGDPAYPYDPVTKQGGSIVTSGTKFAYDELLMLALVVKGSQVPLDPALRVAVQIALAKLADWIHAHITGGKRAMMCTEVVCTSFWRAARNRRYAINVFVGASRATHLLAASYQPVGRAVRGKGAMATVSASEHDHLRQKCARLLLQAAGPTRRKSLRISAGARAPSFAGGAVLQPAGGPLVPLGCVTPFDLEESPNLTLVGRL